MTEILAILSPSSNLDEKIIMAKKARTSIGTNALIRLDNGAL
jgi:hypothetical protein